MNLPHDLKVSVSKLSSCFRNTSATYKYYWLLAIIESIEEGKDEEGVITIYIYIYGL